MTKHEPTSNEGAKSSIWGGRFASGPSQLMQDINASISYDQRLYRQDIAGSKAHATMLAACGIITAADCRIGKIVEDYFSVTGSIEVIGVAQAD